ncbi:PREDICTED: transcription factor Adf-1-like [Papilio xuthus]|uniref:Transcription factor Adf-1 n=1 Tax=Papilio xuthus TaxID=66420 RepID=A0A194PPK6_PAPXU|nr:PREDICTED: transcription factor Adf-1-like [Papilio xuthus]KPI95247.1 Transcription factor Adf-1 [Papilio xuthus]
MLFTQKLDLKLIQLVRENPVLYDHNNAKYMDCNAREVAWHKIGDELQNPAADCKVRWINIRDVYRRILKKKISDSEPRKRYKYENELAFMRPFFKEVRAPIFDYESDTNNEQVSNDCYDEGPPSDTEDDTPITKLKRKKSSKSNSKKKKANRYEEEEQMSVSLSEVTTPVCDFDRSDPVDSFLLSIGATLKTFSPYHLNIAKTKIFNVVQEHDLQQIVEKKRSEESIADTSQKYSDYTH